jgi:hypothetical protein
MGGIKKVLWLGVDEKGRKVPSGVYFYKLKTSTYTETKRITLVR